MGPTGGFRQALDSTRRARRHDQRVAALAVTGVLVAGLGVGIGLRGDLGGRVEVRSTRTGKVVRTLFGPHPFATRNYAVGMSPDRATVYFSNRAPIPVRSRGSSGSRPAAASRSGSWAARTPRA